MIDAQLERKRQQKNRVRSDSQIQGSEDSLPNRQTGFASRETARRFLWKHDGGELSRGEDEKDRFACQHDSEASDDCSVLPPQDCDLKSEEELSAKCRNNCESWLRGNQVSDSRTALASRGD